MDSTASLVPTSRDTPNPLRPYYVPPSIGLPPDPSPSAAGGAVPRPFPGSASSRSTSIPSSQHPSRDFRTLFDDLDYGDYLSGSSNSFSDMSRRLVYQGIWDYTSVILAQPFEVAKVVLQCHEAGASAEHPRSGYAGNGYDRSYSHGNDAFEDSESDSDTPSYFQPTTPNETPSCRQPRRRRPISREQSSFGSYNPSTGPSPISLNESNSIREALVQLWTKEGPSSIWKGTNSTFMYSVLLRTIESWLRGLFSAILNIPEPAVTSAASPSLMHLSILDSPSPGVSAGVIVAAAGMAGLILAPLDIVRTRSIISPKLSRPRHIVPSLRALPSLSCPLLLFPITLLHSTIPALFRTSVPLFLRSSLGIHPIHTPNVFPISSFLVALGELFVKLPLETVLRRGHVATLSQPASSSRGSHTFHPQSGLAHQPYSSAVESPFTTILPVGPYKGVLGTMLFIVQEEGSRIPPSSSAPAKTSIPSTPTKSLQQALATTRPLRNRGQGFSGLWRGWRIGFWGLVGMWFAPGFGGTGGGNGEF